MQQTGPVVSKNGLDRHGIHNVRHAHWNYSVTGLYREALRRSEGVLAEGGGLVTATGAYTGRSPKDKFFVKEPTTEKDIWWGTVNNPISPEAFDTVHKRITSYFQNRDVYVQDLWAGADPDYRLNVRIITENAWHSLFARNMFIVPAGEARREFEPEFTVIQAPNLQSIPEVDGTRSEVCILVSLTRKTVLVLGSHYTGEIKKSIFTVLNWLLPAQGVMPMHASANVGPNGDSAIFFGLSGTGKTTLSSDSTRTLIGDDEIGWSDKGVFNFEGGCYAKAIRLSAESEPEIFQACHRFGTILENVVVDPLTGQLDFDDGSLAENSRASYPLTFIPNASDKGMGGHPRNIVMLTADAFGVLPPISQLSAEQAMYHFLSGYTARVAGTERGLGNEPQATFSTCFGAPFLPRHPTVYARLLGKKIAEHGAKCWLVNTGWSGGAFGVGARMKIAHTRAMVRAALAGKLGSIAAAPDPNFGLIVPQAVPDVPADVLNPRNTWKDKKGYDETARDLAKRFEANFKQFESHVDEKVKQAAIRPAA
ncbi:MAG: phosphoenolpyruvate carboxykinase [Alphaproteobacteria bacterium]|nr:phosphoenolpyruvate carboxykinase [Alphaproteobacteria bacterium]